MYYKLDLIKLARQVLPPVLRGKRLFALIRILLLPFVFVYKQFVAFRKEALGKQAVTGQVLMIEKLLNDHYALTNKEIYLSDAPLTNIYLYKQKENQIPVVLYRSSEEQGMRYLLYEREGQYDANFTVNVPSFLADSLEEIKWLVDHYKPAGRTYKIHLYEYE